MPYEPHISQYFYTMLKGILDRYQAAYQFDYNTRVAFEQKLYSEQQMATLFQHYTWNGQINWDGVAGEVAKYIEYYLQNQNQMYAQQAYQAVNMPGHINTLGAIRNVPPLPQTNMGSNIPIENNVMSAWAKNYEQAKAQETPATVPSAVQKPPTVESAVYRWAAESAEQYNISEYKVPEVMLDFPLGKMLTAHTITFGNRDLKYIQLDTDLQCNNDRDAYTTLKLNYPELFCGLYAIVFTYGQIRAQKVPVNMGKQVAQAFDILQMKARSCQSLMDFKTIMLPAMKNEVADNGYWSNVLMEYFNDIITTMYKTSNNPVQTIKIDNWKDLDIITDSSNPMMAHHNPDYGNLETAVWCFLYSALDGVFLCGDNIAIDKQNIPIFTNLADMNILVDSYLLRDYYLAPVATQEKMVSWLKDNYIIHTLVRKVIYTNVPHVQFASSRKVSLLPAGVAHSSMHVLTNICLHAATKNSLTNSAGALVPWKIYSWDDGKEELTTIRVGAAGANVIYVVEKD